MARFKASHKRSAGFTLIELMIVVAIIGILAAIAVPNYIRFQLRSKAGEGKIHVAGIRAAQESYFAEYGSYLTGTPSPASWAPGVGASQKMVWSDAGGFDTIGWDPDGAVYYQYAARTTGSTPYTEVLIEGRSDIDADSAVSVIGFVQPALGAASVSFNGTFGSGACAGTGTYNVTTAAKDQLEVVGPCDQGMSITIF